MPDKSPEVYYSPRKPRGWWVKVKFPYPRTIVGVFKTEADARSAGYAAIDDDGDRQCTLAEIDKVRRENARKKA